MTTPRNNTRAQRALHHIVEKGRTTTRACVIAIEPGCSPVNMNSSLYALVTAGKLITKRVDNLTWFYPTAAALVDGRKAANAAKAGKPRNRRSTPLSDAHAGTARKPRTTHREGIDADAKAALRNRKLTTARVLQPSALRTPPRPAGTEPETVEQYLRRGGHVEQLPNGATGQPFAHIGHEAINEASWRARVRADDLDL